MLMKSANFLLLATSRSSALPAARRVPGRTHEIAVAVRRFPRGRWGQVPVNRPQTRGVAFAWPLALAISSLHYAQVLHACQLIDDRAVVKACLFDDLFRAQWTRCEHVQNGPLSRLCRSCLKPHFIHKLIQRPFKS